ncbi:hypothetical protein AgCh_039343 [Apium graveolens]
MRGSSGFADENAHINTSQSFDITEIPKHGSSGFANENAHINARQSFDNTETPKHDLCQGYIDFGNPDKLCPYCKAIMWNNERNNKSNKHASPTFSVCCQNGQVQLPLEKPTHPFLAKLLSGGNKTQHYIIKIRIYNSLFAFTSIRDKIDNSINRGGAPYIFKLCGQNYHLIGSIFPTPDESPKFCQLYVYDTKNEIENRNRVIHGSDFTDADIIKGLLMLDENNQLVNSFRMARDRFKNNEPEEVQLELVSCKAADGRSNNVGPSNEYPLLFPHGDEGFHLKIPLMGKNGGPPPRIIEDEDDGEESKQRCYVSMRFSEIYVPVFKDSLAICYSIGHPSFFLTMTYNTKWPEIQSMLQHMSGVNVANALDLVARVFKMKLDQLVDLIKNQNYFGRCTGLMYVIEFLKRGLLISGILYHLERLKMA